MTDWHVADGGRLLGVFTEEALRAARDRGGVPSDARIWREGMDDWAPIARYFPRARRQRRRGGDWLAGLLLTLVSVIYLASFIAALGLMYAYGSDLLPTEWVGLVWRGVGIALAGAAVLAPILWGLRGGRAEVGGMIRIVAVLLAVAGLAVAGFELYQAPYAAEIAEASQAMRDYSLDYDPRSRTLSIEGHIGPGLTDALKRQFDQHPIQRVDILSPGGLVDEAMSSARVLERQPGLEVVARSFCASACVIVLMGGERRLADYDMDIHFHAIDALVEHKTEWWAVMMRRQGEASDRYMVQRGAPEAALKEAARLGPGKLYRVPAVDLVGGGMLAAVLDEEDRPLTAAQARERLRAEEIIQAPAGATPNV